MKMNRLLSYRSAWLGVAMLWIALVHSGIVIPSYTLSRFQSWGYGGVDICLFASGIGCYYSLEKDSDAFRFLQRRFRRLAPAFYCVIPIWILFQSFTQDFPFSAIVGNLLGVQSFSGLRHSFNWYISALLLLYLLCPYLKTLCDNICALWKHLLVLFLLLAVSIPFWTVSNLIITVTRLPIFYLGIFFGQQCYRGQSLSCKQILLLLLATLLGFLSLAFCYRRYLDYLWPYGLHWYPFLLITPGLCVLISLFLDSVSRFSVGRFLNRVLSLIGSYSFELYLIHCPLFELLNTLFDTYEPPHENLLWFATIPVLVLLCLLLRKASHALLSLFQRHTPSVPSHQHP